MKSSGAYEAVAQTYDATVLEYNPFAHTQSPAISFATIVGALHADVEELAQVVAVQEGVLAEEQATALRTTQATLHGNIEALQLLAQQPAPPFKSLLESAPAGPHSDEATFALRDAVLRAIAQLGRINQSIGQLGQKIGAEGSDRLRAAVHPVLAPPTP